MNVSHHQRDGFFDPAVSVRAEFSAKAMDPKLAPARREIRGCDGLKRMNGHNSIIAAKRQNARSLRRESAPGAEVEDSILLGGNSNAVAHSGMEAPVFQRGQKFFIELGAHAVQNSFANDFSALVNRDLDHHVAFQVRQFPRIDHWIDRNDW